MSAVLVLLITGALIMSFALYVEKRFELYFKDVGKDGAKSSSKTVLCIISFIPIVNIALFMFYLVKYLVYLLDGKDIEDV